MAVSVPGYEWSSKYGLLTKTRGGTEWKELTGKNCEEPSDGEPPMTCPKIKKKWSVLINNSRKKHGMVTVPRVIQDLEHVKQCITKYATHWKKNTMSNSKLS